MNHVNISNWYNSLRNEFESNSLSIEKVSRRSEYWRKSNLDIVSDIAQDTSEVDLSYVKGTFLYEPELTINGDVLESVDLIAVAEKAQRDNRIDTAGFDSLTESQIITKACDQLGIITANRDIFGLSESLLNSMNQHDKDEIAKQLDANESANTIS